MLKRKYIRIDPVEEHLYVYVGSADNYVKTIKKDFKDLGDIDDNWDGFHGYLELKDGDFAHVIYLEKLDTGLIFHEITHCVQTVIDNSGIDNDEFRAYLSQHLYYEIVRKFNIKELVGE
jgi:hypothetical protein